MHPVDEQLPVPRLAALGLQHVLVMYAGAVAVPLIVGRALKLSPEQVAMLISADLFCCGLVTLIQSWGMTRWFGVRLPVMMGVTFAAVGPMVAMASANPGVAGAQALFGAIIGAGIVVDADRAAGWADAALLSAGGDRHHHRGDRHQPDARGHRLGDGRPGQPGAVHRRAQARADGRSGQGRCAGQRRCHGGVGGVAGASAPAASVAPQAAAAAVAATTAAASPQLRLPGPMPQTNNPTYGALDNLAIAAFVLVAILLISKYGRGFVANISVLLGIVLGCVVAALLGKMTFGKVAKAPWLDVVTPFAFGAPTFDAVAIVTMVLVMIVVMIESTGMFLALSEITGKPLGQRELTAGLRTDGLGTLIGGIFNTFPYTSFSQNVGLVGVTGVRSRYVCVAAGLIMVVLGLLPKMAALVEAVPQFVLGGAGLVMFGMVAATGIRILAGVDFKGNRHNLYIVAISIGFGMLPLVAPRWMQQMPHALHPLLESGILLAALSAVLLNLFFNGGRVHTTGDAVAAARAQDAHA